MVGYWLRGVILVKVGILSSVALSSKQSYDPSASPSSVPSSAPSKSPFSMPSEFLNFPMKRSWSIEGDGKPVSVQSATGSLAISLSYNISNRIYNTTLLSDDCKTTFNGTAAQSLSLSTIEIGGADGFVQFNAVVDINHKLLMSDTTWWTNVTRAEGYVTMCLYTALYSDDAKTEEVSFMESTVNVTVNYGANFNVTNIQASRVEGTSETTSINYSNYLNAYLCDADAPTVELVENSKIYSQNQALTLCVTDDKSGVVNVDLIYSLTVSQQGSQSFTYIEGPGPNDFNDELLVQTCDNGICVAKMQLLGRFFNVAEPKKLTVNGSVVLSFSNGDTHRPGVDISLDSSLSRSNNRRNQENEESLKGGFDILVQVQSDEESGSHSFKMVSPVAAATLMGGAILLM